MDRQDPIAIARELLPAGMELLEEQGYELRCGGLDAGREEILALVEGAAAVVGDPTVTIDAELLDRAGPGLRVVSNFAVGFDSIDVAACAERGVIVTNTPGVLTTATAELTVALSLATTRGLFDAAADLRAGRWSNWDPTGYAGPRVYGALVGVVGMGRIGEEYARMMRGLGAEIVYWNRSAKPDAEAELGARRLELEELVERADIISVHAAATPETYHLIDGAMLARAKPTAILVNTARGSIVDEPALAAALREERLWAVGLDVFENEPEVPAELLAAPRAVLLPHIGSATRHSRDEMSRLVARNIIAVLSGEEPLTPVAVPGAPA